MTHDASPTPRVQHFYCPYCAEEDFVPFGEEPNRYFCRSCRRHYVVKFIGLGTADVDGDPNEERADAV